MNYYPKHIGDYLKDTAGLSMTEDGAYGRLLDQYYNAEHALPLEIEACCRLARVQSRTERAAVTRVLGLFFTKTEFGYRQKRAEEEIATYLAKSAKARASADARWKSKGAKPKAHANASSNSMRTHGGNDANASTEGMRTHDEKDANAMLSRARVPQTNNQDSAAPSLSPLRVDQGQPTVPGPPHRALPRDPAKGPVPALLTPCSPPKVGEHSSSSLRDDDPPQDSKKIQGWREMRGTEARNAAIRAGELPEYCTWKEGKDAERKARRAAKTAPKDWRQMKPGRGAHAAAVRAGELPAYREWQAAKVTAYLAERKARQDAKARAKANGRKAP